MKLSEPQRQKLEKEFLAADEAYKPRYILTYSGLKESNFDSSGFSAERDLHLCVRSTTSASIQVGSC